MGRQERMALIKKIEEQTCSKVLVYITGDRQGLETQVSSDVVPFIYKHLEKNGTLPKITLFIYTTGGVTISGYGIVNLIREHCLEYDIMIPFKCLSTGTLMALGANSIIMSKMGQLGPVDPSLNHPLGPKINNPQIPSTIGDVPVNVEDVISFFDLAKKEAKTHSENEFTKILTILAQGIHPLVLGAVNRSRNEIRFLAKTLLGQHMTDNDKINSIVKTLIEERFSHSYLIGRKEAKDDLKLNVIDVSDDVIITMMKLYNEYNLLLKLDTPYNPGTGMDGDEVDLTLHRCIVESHNLTHTFSTVHKINRVGVSEPQTGLTLTKYNITPIKDEWMENNDV